MFDVDDKMSVPADLDAWIVVNTSKNKRRIPVKDRLEQPNTYASKLKKALLQDRVPNPWSLSDS